MTPTAERRAVAAATVVCWIALTAVCWAWPRVGLALVSALTVGVVALARAVWRDLAQAVGDAR